MHRIYSGIVIDWESRIKPLARARRSTTRRRAREFLTTIPNFVCKVDVLVRQIETDLEGRIQKLRLVLGIGFFVMMMLVVAALFLLNIEVFQPIARLAEAAKRVRTGDFRVRAESTGPDEIGQLGQAFNFMVDDLSRLYGSLEKQVAEKTRDLERRNESLALLYETTRMLAEKPVDSELADAGAGDGAAGARRRERRDLLDPRRQRAWHAARARRDHGEGLRRRRLPHVRGRRAGDLAHRAGRGRRAAHPRHSAGGGRRVATG